MLPPFALTLSHELEPFNIKSILIQPGYFQTSFLGGASQFTTPHISDYNAQNEAFSAYFNSELVNGQSQGVRKGAQVVYEVITSTGRAEGRKAPKEFLLGSDAVANAEKMMENLKEGLEAWREVSTEGFPGPLKL
ncbi:hypothetical protein RUND412_009170 [Rhizina undulata]